jgi:hypothetical protein
VTETCLLPAVCCLCPTYGRFERLRDAVACFLLQEYPGTKTLLVLNDAQQNIMVIAGHISGHGIRVANTLPRFPNLGAKRQWLLEAAHTPLVAHWDDDDLYLPWHLSMVVGTLVTRQAAAVAGPRPTPQASRLTPPFCVKPGAAWWVHGPREGPFDVRGIHHNIFEGQMVFERERALALGGYPPLDSGQAKALLDAFHKAGELHTWNPNAYQTSYVYRWGDGADHVSGRPQATTAAGGGPGRDQDWGEGQPIVPEFDASGARVGNDAATWARARLHGPFRALAAGAAKWLNPADHRSFSKALRVSRTTGTGRPNE